jgi:uncharacterized UBP type Zn finger protein
MMQDPRRLNAPASRILHLASCILDPASLAAKSSRDKIELEVLMPQPCKHLDRIKFTKTEKDYCEDCVKTDDTWVHLRMCLTCGHVGCCDSSKNKHATKHFHHTNHPLIRSLESDENWVWCYVDEIAAGELIA